MSTWCFCSTSGALCARLFVKGAAEIVLDQCALRVAEDSSVTYLGDEEKQQILQCFADEGSLRWGMMGLTGSLDSVVASYSPACNCH